MICGVSIILICLLMESYGNFFRSRGVLVAVAAGRVEAGKEVLNVCVL
jgi:hypothetical protein